MKDHSLMPIPDSDSMPFWEACRREVLQFQLCTDCSALRHPPRVICPQCRSENHRWEPVSGKGTIYSYTIYRRAFHPSLEKDLPYAVALIDLEENLRIVSRIIDIPMDTISIGMPVTVRFVEIDKKTMLPFFSAVD
jgi:uncharacterized OB-fold protein